VLQGLADSDIGQGWVPGVHIKTLDTAEILGGHLIAFDRAAIHGRSGVAGCPVARIPADAEIGIATEKRFEQNFPIQIVVVLDGIKIPQTSTDRQIGGPIIGHPLVADRPAEIEIDDLVGTAAHRRIEQVPGNVAPFGFPPMFGRCPQAGNLGEFIDRGAGGVGECDFVRALDGGFDHFGELGLQEGLAVLPDRLEGKGDVLGLDRFAIVKTRLGPKLEADEGAVGVVGDGFGQQPVIGRQLVLGFDHQRVVGERPVAGEFAPKRNPVQRFELRPHGQPHFTAFGRIGIGVGKMFEVGRQVRLAKFGQCVGFDDFRPSG